MHLHTSQLILLLKNDKKAILLNGNYRRMRRYSFWPRLSKYYVTLARTRGSEENLVQVYESEVFSLWTNCLILELLFSKNNHGYILNKDILCIQRWVIFWEKFLLKFLNQEECCYFRLKKVNICKFLADYKDKYKFTFIMHANLW